MKTYGGVDVLNPRRIPHSRGFDPSSNCGRTTGVSEWGLVFSFVPTPGLVLRGGGSGSLWALMTIDIRSVSKRALQL
jgi:hypothetical protein